MRRVTRIALPLLLMALAAESARAEYIVLRNGQRLTVTSYQVSGDKYRLRVNGGVIDVAASDVVAIEPQETFVAVPAVPVVETSTEPFGEPIPCNRRRCTSQRLRGRTRAPIAPATGP